jgi:hypothetical protein
LASLNDPISCTAFRAISHSVTLMVAGRMKIYLAQFFEWREQRFAGVG